jgi:polyferredoxin
MKSVNVVFGIANAVYTIISLTLALISVAMVTYAVWEVWIAIAAGAGIIGKILDAIGLIVVAVAVFDVAKYLMEEEVLRDRELRSAREARRTLTKFIVIITIAVNLEALVFIFGAGSTDISTLLYPTALLTAGTLMVIGLGIFQRLSVSAENESDTPTPMNDQ